MRACVERHWAIWAARHGLNFARVLEQVHGRRTVDTIRAVAPELDAEDEARDLNEAVVMDESGISAAPGAIELLHELPKDTWAIVTSGTRLVALARLAYVGLPVPACLITADDVDYGKPHPQGYATAARLLSASPSECVVVEDTPAGIASAHAASIRAIAVTSTHPPHGLTDADFRIESLQHVRAKPLGAKLGRPAALELELHQYT